MPKALWPSLLLGACLSLQGQETPYPNRLTWLSIFPEPLPEGVTQFSLEASNQFIRQNRQDSPDGRTQAQLQGDDYELVSDFATQAGTGRLNLRTRLMYHTEGYASRLIMNWHDLIGVGDCGRDSLPAIQERYQLVRDGVQVVNLTRPRLEMQGLDLAYLRPLGTAENGGRVGGSLQLPTGGASWLQSSGGVNFMAGAAGWKTVGAFRFWAQGEDIWISLPGGSPLRSVVSRGQFWRAWVGVAYQGPGGSFLRDFGLDVSLGYNETPYGTGLVRLDKYGLIQTWVVRHRSLPRWRFGFTEKAGTFSTPEISGFVTFRP